MQKNNNLDNRFGFKWTNEEDKILLKLVSEDKTIDEIANEHKRTTGAIRARLYNHAYKLHKQNHSIDDIYNKLKLLNRDMLEKVINYRKSIQNTIKEKKGNKNNYDLLIKLNSIVNVLVEIELKRSKITKSNFDKLVANDISKQNIFKYITNNDELPRKLETNNNEEEEFIWKHKILIKIIKYIKNEDRLKILKEKYNIPEKAFNDKINELKNNLLIE